ncbi:ABC-three component system protein (plasmid) [Azospirillum melinis]|uniref:ABC-three component system protein n=1 Tax=Azospirillum melinis TaxID=328839 RepID=UPI003757EA97
MVSNTVAARVDAPATGIVFLAHNSRDRSFVTGIKDALWARGVPAWQDIDNILPGRFVNEQIEEALAAHCRVFVYCVGPHGIGNVQRWERDFGRRLAQQEKAILVIVLLPGVTVDPLSFEGGLSPVIFKSRPDEEEPIARIAAAFEQTLGVKLPPLHATGHQPAVHSAPAAEPVANLLEIRSAGSSGVVWSGLPLAQNAAELWDSSAPPRNLRLGFSTSDEPGLTRVVLRLVSHMRADGMAVETPASCGWRVALMDCLKEWMPTQCEGGLRLSESLSLDEVKASPAPAGRVLTSGARLAEQIEISLDHWCLDRLDDGVEACLKGQAVAPEMAVEPSLAADLLHLWESWRRTLRREQRILHRFLEMLVSVEDGESHEWSRFGLGRHSVWNCMVPATIMMLAVAECGNKAIHPQGDEPLHPHGESPGNLAGKTLYGHGTGISRKGGRSIEEWICSKSRLPWRSRIVLLSGVTLSPPILRCRIKPFTASRSDASFQSETLSKPAIVTLEKGFRSALQHGRDRVETYLGLLFRDLHNQQTPLLIKSRREALGHE